MKQLILLLIALALLIQSCHKDQSVTVKPEVSTTAITAIGYDSARGGGVVSFQTSASIIARGICWSKTANPTIADFKTLDGAGTGQFNSVLTDLSPVTTYHVRAYATTSEGTFYGDDVEFKTTMATLELEAIKDTSIFNNLAGDSPQKDYGAGGSELLRVGYSQSEDAYARTLIQFDVTGIPSNAVIDSVSLQFTTGKSGTNLSKILMYRLTQAWSEGTTTEGCNYYSSCQTMGSVIAPTGTDATWINTMNTTLPWNTPGGTFISTVSATSTDANATPDFFTSTMMLDDVQGWVTTPSSNFGWILKIDEPSVTTTGALKRYVSREAVLDPLHPATKPTLTVVYH